MAIVDNKVKLRGNVYHAHRFGRQ